MSDQVIPQNPVYLRPDDMIAHVVINTPSIFAATNYELCSLKVLDHIFNNIGGGMEEIHFRSSDKKIVKTIAQKWFNCERAAYGYIKTKTFVTSKNTQIVMGDGAPTVTVPVAEMPEHPHIVHWCEFDTITEFTPYPYFEKPYSFVWDSPEFDFTVLGKEWIQAAIWYYTRAAEFFNDDVAVRNYQLAFPQKTTVADARQVASYRKAISSTEHYPTNESITEAYECEFIGDRNCDADVEAFVRRYWKKEHARILSFIDETLTMLWEQLK